MTASNFDEALKRVLAHEGGYSNNAADPGGPTKYGITIADVRRYIKPQATAEDVKRLTLDQARIIYRARYWAVMSCDDLPSGVDYAVFDYGVNSGTGRAAKSLQAAVRATVDGKIGPKTINAARKIDPAKLVAAICDERLAFLQRLKTWKVFGKGWGRRVAEVKSGASAMAAAGRKIAA